MRIPRCAALAGILPLVTAAAAHPPDYPFVGRWDCEVAVFAFTARTYHNGSETLTIRRVAPAEGGFVLSFDGGYEIALLDVEAATMTWLSLATDDRFACRRIG